MLLTVYQGRNVYNKTSKFFTTDKEWARNFTQSGRDSEIHIGKIDPKVIYQRDPLPAATDEKQIEDALKEAQVAGYMAIWVDEGKNEPPGILMIDMRAVRIHKQSMLNEGVIKLHPKDKSAISKYLKDMDRETKTYIKEHGYNGWVESRELIHSMNYMSHNLPSNEFPFDIKYIFNSEHGGYYQKETNTIFLVVGHACKWEIGYNMSYSEIYKCYSVDFKKLSQVFIHEFVHYIQHVYRSEKTGNKDYALPQNWTDKDRYYKWGWEQQAHALDYLEYLKQHMNIVKPEKVLSQLKKMGLLHRDNLNKLKTSDYKSWKAIMKQAIMAAIADLKPNKL